MDVCNGINSPARFYRNAEFIAECFAKLGKWIVSCHAKDLAWIPEYNVHFREVVPGRGQFDYATYLREMSKLPVDAPLMLEHLQTAEEYSEGAESHPFSRRSHRDRVRVDGAAGRPPFRRTPNTDTDFGCALRLRLLVHRDVVHLLAGPIRPVVVTFPLFFNIDCTVVALRDHPEGRARLRGAAGAAACGRTSLVSASCTIGPGVLRQQEAVAHGPVSPAARSTTPGVAVLGAVALFD